MNFEQYTRTMKYILQEIWVGDSSKILQRYLENIQDYPPHIQQLISFLHSTAVTRALSANVTAERAELELGIVALTLVSMDNALSRPESDSMLSNEQELIFLKLLKDQEDDTETNTK